MFGEREPTEPRGLCGACNVCDRTSVEHVALATSLPLWHYGNTRQITNDKLASADPAALPRGSHVMITADYFNTLGIKLVEGRTFAADIKPTDPQQVVINEALAKQFWPGQSAIGLRLGSIGTDQTPGTSRLRTK